MYRNFRVETYLVQKSPSQKGRRQMDVIWSYKIKKMKRGFLVIFERKLICTDSVRTSGSKLSASWSDFEGWRMC